MFNLELFINEYVTHRGVSMFMVDINSHISELRNTIEGRSVLVIGGAGSIGTSFVHAIIPFHPSEICVVDTNENALTELTRDIRSSGAVVPNIYLSYPMDYNSITFKRMFRTHCGFDIVANFSAHKHVRSEKDIYSIEALIRNNIINAKYLLELLLEYKPATYFCVSTDKAANPVNIMGASKRIMEDLIFSYSDSFCVKTARFANVAFSNGSLLAGFLERINKFQPISAPSDVRRYFVSPVEAGQICMLAAMLGNNREIFFPKLGKSQMTTFDAIAEDLLKAHGYEIKYCRSDKEAVRDAIVLRDGNRTYPVHFSTSDTSGEKAFEEFFTKGEIVDNDRFKSLGVITGKTIPIKEEVNDLIVALEEIFGSLTGEKEDIVHVIESYLPNFKHIETGKSLDGKM